MQEYAVRERKDRLLRCREDIEERLRKIREKEYREEQLSKRGGHRPKRQVLLGTPNFIYANFLMVRGPKL